MPIIGTNFIKLNVERKERKEGKGKVNINNNLGIKDVIEMNLRVGKNKQPGVKFVFEFETIYEPDIAKFEFLGEVLYIADKEECQEILKAWKDKKPVNEDVMSLVMNSALTKSTIKSLQLSQEMNLPAPIKLPHVTKKK